MATLLDTAGGIVLWPYLDDPFSASSIGVSRVRITSETPEGDTKTVAVGQGVYRLLQAENMER